MPRMAADIHGFLRKKTVDATNDYVSDLKALTHDQLNTSPGGGARTAYDFTLEIVQVNERIAKRLRGEVPPPPGEGWTVAPAEFQNKGVAIDAVTASGDAVVAAWDALPPGEMDKEIVLSSGAKMTPMDLMYLASVHLRYHGAQLNYIQSMVGDTEIHWGR